MGSRCRRIAFAALVAALLGAVVAPVEAVGPEEAALLSAASAANKRSSGFRDIEPGALAAADAERQGDTLTLRPRAGPARTYTDRPECKGTEDEAKCIAYTLVFHIRSYDVFVILKQYYENAEFLLIDDISGDETVVEGFPHLSPSGRRAAVIVNGGDQDQAIQIWRRQGSRFALDWSKAPYSNRRALHTEYTFSGWRSDDVAALEAESSLLAGSTLETRFALRRAAEGWRVVGPAEPKASVRAAALTRADFVGGWRLTADGATCQLFATLTPFTIGSRGITRACASTSLQAMAAWDLRNGRFVLLDTAGSIVATLTRTGPERFAGKTADGKSIRLGR